MKVRLVYEPVRCFRAFERNKCLIKMSLNTSCLMMIFVEYAALQLSAREHRKHYSRGEHFHFDIFWHAVGL